MNPQRSEVRPRRTTAMTCFVAALASLLILSACRADAKVETAETPTVAPAENANPEASPGSDDTAQDQPASENDNEPATTTDSNDATEVDDPPEPGPPEDDPAEDDTPEPEATAVPEPTETPVPPPPAEPLYDLQGELPLSAEEVNALIGFIQEETGRDFLRPPVIVAQSAAEFEEGLQPQLDEFQEGAEAAVRSLQSLGLTEMGVTEVTEAFVGLLTSPDAGIQGYYDTVTEELYVPVDVLGTDDFRSLLVHELTHALDGQHADLLVLDELSEAAKVSKDYERLAGYQAVLEGRASSVQNRWIAANNVTQDEPDLSLIEGVPPALVFELSVPYAFGEQFVELNGGPGNTWDLLESPPVSSEEVLIPGTGIGVEEIIDVAVPAADGPVIDNASFGASDLLVWLLGKELEPDPSLIFPTLTAIDGWAGGNSVLWGDDTESCTRIAFAADSADDLAEIQEVIELWVDDGDSRTVVADGDLVTVTGCAPYVP